MTMIEILKNEPLAGHTTYGVGGPAKQFASVKSEDELREALDYAQKNNLRVVVLGGGSNVLISDEGFDGLVIKNEISGWSPEMPDKKVLLTVGAGEAWDSVVARAVVAGWAGLECLSGIPGSVGGALVQNIGAYGQTLADVVERVTFLDTEKDLIETCDKAACEFVYRGSRFEQAESGRYIITAVTLRLDVTKVSACDYKDYRFDMTAYMDKESGAPTLRNVRSAILDVREQKGMVRLPGRQHLASAGSVFKNPVVEREQFEQMQTVARERNAELEESRQPWHWDVERGQVKISAAFLLEYTEFTKGYARDHVGISPKHTLSVINLGGATAVELRTFIDDMRADVDEIFGIKLELEIKLI